MIPETSLAANESVTPEMREAIHKKIVNALEVIGAGHFEDIAEAAQLEDAKVWKRLIECRRAGKIVEVPFHKKLKSGRFGMCYSLPGKTVKLTA